MGGHWLWHLDVPRRRREEPGVARLGAGAYCVSDLLVRNEILCSRSHRRRYAVSRSQPLVADERQPHQSRVAGSGPFQPTAPVNSNDRLFCRGG